MTHEMAPEAKRRVKSLLADRPPVRWGVVFLSTVLISIGIVVGGLGLIVWRLSQGPLSLPMLTERVLADANAQMPPGHAIAASGVSLSRSDDGLVVRLTDPVISAGQQPQLRGDSIEVTIEALSLLSGAVRVTHVSIEGPKIALLQNKEGAISVAGSSASPPTRSIGMLLDELDAAASSVSTLSEIEVRKTDISVFDERTGKTTKLPPLTARLRRTADVGGLAVTLSLDTGASLTATLTRKADGSRFVDASARNVSTDDLSQILSGTKGRESFKARFDAIARASIQPDGTLGSTTLSLRVDGGVWRPKPDIRPFDLEEAGIGLRWDPEKREIAVETATFRAGDAGVAFTGRITPPVGGNVWDFNLTAPNATISGANPGDPPLRLDKVELEGSWDPTGNVLAIERSTLSGPTASLLVQGAIVFQGDSPGFNLIFTGSSMPVGAFKRLWPFFAAPKARAWFGRNVRGGTVEEASVALAIAPGAIADPLPLPDDAVAGEVRFSQTSVNVLDSFPDISSAKGGVSFSARSLSVQLDSGVLDIPEGKLALSEGHFEIPDFVPANPKTSTAFRLKGEAGGFAALIKREPIAGTIKSIDFDPKAVKGGADLAVTLGMPLIAMGPAPRVDYAVKGRVTDVTIDGFEGNRLEGATLDLDIAPGVLRIDGKGRFAGAPATVSYDRSGEAPAKIQLDLTVDDKVRAKNGMDFGDAFTGPVGVSVDVDQGSTSGGYVVNLDLSKAAIDGLFPGWKKPAGRAGKARFTIRPDGDTTLLDEIELKAGTFALSGSARLDADGKLQRARLSSLRASEGDDISAVIERGDTGYAVTLKGNQLDVRPMIRVVRSGSPDKNRPPPSVAIDVKRALGFGDEVMTDFSASVATSKGGITALSISGNLDGKPVKISKTSDGYPVDVQNAGSFFRFLDFYDKMRGGRIEGGLGSDGKSGLLVVHDFNVIGEPALGRFYAAANTAPRTAENLPAPPKISNNAAFQRLRIGFARKDDVLRLNELVVTGPDIGASVVGTIDYGANRVDLVGTFVPAYALNNIFARIPVFGMLLGGGEYEGLFAVTFKVSGSLQKPTLFVNPLSAIAPGVLRKFFEFQKQDR